MQETSNLKVAGSNPAERTFTYPAATTSSNARRRHIVRRSHSRIVGPRGYAAGMPTLPRSSDGLDDSDNGLHWFAFQRHLRAAGRSPDTIALYRRCLLGPVERYPDRSLVDLPKADLETFMAERLDVVEASTVGVAFRSLRAFYNWCVREELLDRSPMAGMVEPKPTDRPPPIVDDADLDALLKACAGTGFVDRRDTAIIRLFNESGSPRVAEMAGLRLEHLDMRHDLVRVHGKGDKIRAIPFGSRAGQALDRYLRVRGKQRLAAASTHLWLGPRGAFTASGITQMLARRASEAGIGHIHPHQLRHTSAHVWMDNGGSESDAMELYGWSSPEMPRRYGRSARTARAHRASRRMSLGDRI